MNKLKIKDEYRDLTVTVGDITIIPREVSDGDYNFYFHQGFDFIFEEKSELKLKYYTNEVQKKPKKGKSEKEI